MMKTRKKGKWDKIIINIPNELLHEFDRVADMQYYSRSEAIKEAMRQFIIGQMPDDYVSPSMREVVQQQTADAMEGMGKGLARIAGDPAVQEQVARNTLQQQQMEKKIRANFDLKQQAQLPYPGAQKTVKKSLDKIVGRKTKKSRKR